MVIRRKSGSSAINAGRRLPVKKEGRKRRRGGSFEIGNALESEINMFFSPNPFLRMFLQLRGHIETPWLADL